MRKKIVRLLLFALAGVLSLVLLGTGYLYIRKDQVAATLIGFLNKNQIGNISFNDISFTPFKQFPKISLKLEDVAITQDSTSSPFVQVGQVWGSIDILDLFADKIELSHIGIENGFGHLVVDKDGVLNIVETFTTANPRTPTEEPSNQKAVELNLEGISVRNINFSFDDVRSGFSSEYAIGTLDASLTLDSGLTSIQARGKLVVEDMHIHSQTILQDVPLELSTEFLFDNSANRIAVKNGKLTSEDVAFNLDGHYDLSTDFIDVAISAEQNALGLLSFLLDDELIELNSNLPNQGSTYFNGTIKGISRGKIPNFSFDYGARDMILDLPDGTNIVSDFDFQGSMVSGTNPDFSEARISIDSLEANFLNGKMKGSFSIANFMNPSITLDSRGQIDLGNLNSILSTEGIDSMAGDIVFNTKIQSTYIPDYQYFPLDSSTVFIDLQDVLLGITGVPVISGINGKAVNEDSIMQLQQLSMTIDSSIFYIDGSLEKLFDFTFAQSPFSASLSIKTERFNLQDFGFTEESQEVIDFDAYLDVVYSQDKDHSELQLQIEHMQASPDSYPVIEDLSGTMHLTTNDTSQTMTIEDFKTKTPIGNLSSDANLYTDSTETRIDIQNLSFTSPYGRMQFKGNTTYDTTSMSLEGSLSTNDMWFPKVLKSFQGLPLDDSLRTHLTASLNFRTDVKRSDTLDISLFVDHSDFHFVHPELDTVLVEGLNLDIPSFQYIVADSFNIQNVINLKGETKADHARTKYFDVKTVKVETSKKGSNASLEMTSSDLSGDIRSALLSVNLEDSIPAYIVNYTLSNVDLAYFFAQEEEKIIEGNIDFEFNARSSGFEWSEIIKNADGSLLVDGENIQLYGFDLDEVLANYKKSQHFRLTDVGAFMLVGPFGPLVTKGYDFAKVAQINQDDSTTIETFYSNWTIAKEILATEDVAFSTTKSRIAFDGSINLSNLTIPGITVYVLDARGCSLMNQTVSGSFADPDFGDLKVVGKLFGAVINVFKLAAGNQCAPVYSGHVPHPVPQ